VDSSSSSSSRINSSGVCITSCTQSSCPHSTSLRSKLPYGCLPVPIRPALLCVPAAPQSQSDPSRSAAVYEALKDDAELAPVFEDVKANGPAALQK
jgi:hypothetical protein